MASPRQDGMPRNIKSRVFFNILIFSIFEKDQRWSNCSRLSFINIDRDQIALVDLLKRSTMIESFCWSFKQSSIANLLLIFEKDWQNQMLSKNKPFAPKKHIFGKFLIVSPLLCQKSKSLLSIFALQSFLKIDGIDLLVYFFFKEDQQWANWSRWSLKKMDHERIDLVVLYERWTAHRIYLSIFVSQKMSNSIKNDDQIPNPYKKEPKERDWSWKR